MNTPPETIEHQLKTLWGAAAMPFGKTVREPFLWPAFERATARLQQMAQVRSSGVLSGPNGTGKSYLLSRCLAQLPEKRYAVFRLHHTSLSGGDLLRSLCRLLGHRPAFRRSDTLGLIAKSWAALDGRFPLVVIDEAQNLDAPALEELRLLGCADLDTRTLFGLVFAGDLDLLPRLQMGVNRPLLARIAFHVELAPLEPPEMAGYIDARLREVSMPPDCLEPDARLLLCQASGGILRTAGTLARLAIQNAATGQAHLVTAAHVQAALDELPWVAGLQARP